MRQAATQELYDYWNRLRGARLSPERSEINPSDIRHILADTMILEVDDERQYPLRITGARLNALFLDEQKGRSFVNLFAPSERSSASAMIASVIDDSKPIVAGLSAAPEGEKPLSLELLLLPLRHNGKTHARLLGALSPLALPSWLGLRQVEHLNLTSMQFIDEDEADMSTPIFGFPDRHEPVATPAELAARPKRRGRFFIIAGGRNGSRSDLAK